MHAIREVLWVIVVVVSVFHAFEVLLIKSIEEKNDKETSSKQRRAKEAR